MPKPNNHKFERKINGTSHYEAFVFYVCCVAYTRRTRATGYSFVSFCFRFSCFIIGNRGGVCFSLEYLWSNGRLPMAVTYIHMPNKYRASVKHCAQLHLDMLLFVCLSPRWCLCIGYKYIVLIVLAAYR